MVEVTEFAPPHNLEAEQALLGAVLVNNEAAHRVAGFLLPEHFYDGAHQRIYETATDLIRLGRKADPITLKARFEQDSALAEIGGTGSGTVTDATGRSGSSISGDNGDGTTWLVVLDTTGRSIAFYPRVPAGADPKDASPRRIWSDQQVTSSLSVP